MSILETFQLVNETMLLAHINTRKENHGEEIKKGHDFKFVGRFHNSILKKLHPDLMASLYKPNETRDMLNPENMPELRVPKLGSQTYDAEIPRTLLRIHDIDDAKNDVVLGDGKTNKFSFIPMEGGTVELTIRVQYSDPDEEEINKARRVEFQEVKISLTCEAEPVKGDNFEQAESLGKEPMSAAREQAESVFSAPPSSGDGLAGADFTTAAESTEPPKKPKGKRGGKREASGEGIE